MLRDGRHPDTDAAFWNDADGALSIPARDEDREPTSIVPPPDMRPRRVVVRRIGMTFTGKLAIASVLALVVLALVATVGALSLWLVRRNRARKPEPVEVDWL